MSKTKQKKSENDYKCCKLEIYKLTPSFRNSRLSSSERLCWIVWSITRSFTLIYPYPCFFSFWNTYFVINEEKSQISYITMYGISHHQNDTQTQSLCKSLLLFFCFCLFVFFDFGQFIYKLWDWKIACAWKKQFHISRKYAFL
jgi:hypothetical protein